MKKINLIGATWGILGVSIILISAITRVIPHVTDAFRIGLSPFQWAVLIIWCVFMFITEGYRGFQKLFSPRVAARSWHLVNYGKPIDLILAPIYCMGYFHATKKRIITSWTLTAGIALIIVVVTFLSQPWRGIIDSGVVLGLVYGLVWVLIFTYITFKKHIYVVDPESHLNNFKIKISNQKK
jgi:hypothetical protein